MGVFKMRLAVLFVALAAVAAPWCGVRAEDAGDLDINAIIDQLLDGARKEISARGLDQVTLPDISERFRKKVSFISISGRFETHNGWARRLTSLERVGDATVSEQGDKFVVAVPLGLTDLQIGYDYKAKLGKLGPSGHLTASVASNAVSLTASLIINDDTCSLGVDDLRLTDLGKIKVHATGLGKLNFLFSKIVTWVTSKLHDKIENAVQKGLKEAITKAALNINCDSMFGAR